ncbi:hypothetical protein [Desulfovirgula thermocuniculi]|uniref:hypothetical protein n=1 Tax=Desulfovirgula thermocuniculi TaxID=348842 RepID=UPI001B7FEF9E|nr:hypothetical protein [Desulfovirgula thermocuniculi]
METCRKAGGRAVRGRARLWVRLAGLALVAAGLLAGLPAPWSLGMLVAGAGLFLLAGGG